MGSNKATMVHDVEWVKKPSDVVGAVTQDFTLTRQEGVVPGALWVPDGPKPTGLILYGHGGSRHKRDTTVTDFVNIAIHDYKFAVVAIDGPIHGARQSDPAHTPSEVQTAFLSNWKSDDNGVLNMVADWRATIDLLLNTPSLSGLKLGYFGLSMGHAYGVPLIADEPRIEAGIVGLWGVNYPNSELLITTARNIACPVIFMHMSEDGFFTRDGALALFDAMPNKNKRFIQLPGPHGLTDEQSEIGLSFFANRFASR